MCHHAIDISRGNQKTKPWLSVFLKGVGTFIIGLRKDGDTKSCILQDTGDDGNAKGRVIHVGVARYVYKIRCIPATRDHVGTAER